MENKYVNPFEVAKISGNSVTKELANHNSVDQVNICPDPNCGKEMLILKCNGIPTHVCLEHRIAFPCADE